MLDCPRFSPRMYCIMYLDDISSLITIACCVPELHTIEFRPFPIENVPGGGGGAKVAPPSTFSMGNRQNSLAHNSRTQQAVVFKLEISSTDIQYILGGNQGNPAILVNRKQMVVVVVFWLVPTSLTIYGWTREE